MEKIILSPKEIMDLSLHRPTVDPEKLCRINTLSTRPLKVRDRSGGGHRQKEVLAVRPILVAPSIRGPGELHIINGTHRAVRAAMILCNLGACLARTQRDIEFHLPAEQFSDDNMPPDEVRNELVQDFLMRHDYENMCRSMGTPTVRDLVERVRNGVGYELHGSMHHMYSGRRPYASD